MVEDQGRPSGRPGKEAGKAPFLLPSQPPQRQGVPWSTRGEIWSTAEERGNHSGSRSTGEGRQGPPQSKLRSQRKAQRLSRQHWDRMGDTRVQSF